MLQYGGVDAAKISVVLEVTLYQIARREAWILSHESSFDLRACEEHVRGRSMVGPPAGILLHAPAKFAEGHDEHPVKAALCLEVIEKRLERVTQFLEETIVSGGLIGMSVVAALRDVINASRKTSAYESCDKFQ